MRRVVSNRTKVFDYPRFIFTIRRDSTAMLSTWKNNFTMKLGDCGSRRHSLRANAVYPGFQICSKQHVPVFHCCSLQKVVCQDAKFSNTSPAVPQDYTAHVASIVPFRARGFCCPEPCDPGSFQKATPCSCRFLFHRVELTSS